MSVDRSKVLAAAQKHLSKGNYDRAIAEYQRLVDDDPSDVRTWLKIGDLYTRKGANVEATRTYHRVAEHYAEQGFFLKAVAVYKQILKLDPTRLDVSMRLAEMYEHLQLVSDALSTYEQVALAYARAGEMDPMLETLGRMAELDPDNIPVRIKFAEALSKAGRTDDAAREFEIGAELLRDQGRFDDYLKVAERLLYHRPDDTDLAKELSTQYLERNDAKRALGKLQLCFKKDPKDVVTLGLLARAFELLDQIPKTISVYREMARILQEKNELEERAQVLNAILALDPNDAEARQALAGYAPPSRQPPRASVDAVPPGAIVGGDDDDDDAPELEIVEDDEPELEIVEDDDDDVMLMEDFDDELELEIAEDDAIDVHVDSDIAPPAAYADVTDTHTEEVEELEELEPIEELDAIEDLGDFDAVEDAPSDLVERPSAVYKEPPLPAPDEAGARPSIPPEIAREAQIARLLTECDVFSRYGLLPKVINQLRQVLELAPDHVEARERLKDALIEAGKNQEAAAELVALAGLFGDNPQVQQHYLRQAIQLDPTHRVALESLDEDTLPPPLEDDASEDAILFVEDDPSQPSLAPVSEAPELEVSLDSLVPVDFDSLPPESIAPPASIAPPQSIAPPARPAIPPEQGNEVETPVPPQDVTAIAPMPVADVEASFEREESTSPSVVPLSGDQLLSLPPEEPAEGTPAAAAHEEARQRNSMPPGEVEEILDEVDFYIAQGLWDAGAGTLQDALETYAGHPVLLDKLQEIEEGRSAQHAAASIMPPAEDDAFALAEKLAEELGPPEADAPGSDVLDVDQVFEAFKRGVSEQIGMEDTDTHFDLGIAYKEMGLLDDAVSEFELAMANPTRECLCQTMIGLCRIEQGKVGEAISHFKKGLYADTKSEAEELGLYFELGLAYEALEDPKESLYYYQKVQKRDPAFRGVDQRITALTSAGVHVSEAPEAIDIDEVDAAFDDLLGGD